MIRTQIQLPDGLYREVRRVARQQEWSVSEVLRRGAEAVARSYPPSKIAEGEKWTMPPPIKGRLLVERADKLGEIIRGEQEATLK
ncbi:MAG: hypothetical protein RL376_747 [Verrucomicrobiota bacterium]